MRRLLPLVCAVVGVETMFYAAITPLLPALVDEHGLSKAAAGVLAGAYPAGVLVGALPGGWLAARIGVRATVLAGLALMVVASIVFAFGNDVVVLDAARFVQGVGGAASWAGALGWLIAAAPRERRGEFIGTAMGVAIAGSLFGPVLGWAAEAFGQEGVFSAVAVLGCALMAWSVTLPAPGAAGGASGRLLLAALREPRVGAGLWLMALGGMLFGTIGVLGPLRMDRLGAAAGAIAVAWLLSAAIEATMSPIIGRLSDRRGRLAPSLAGLAGGAAIMAALPWPASALLLGALIVVAGPLVGMLWTPAMALVSDGAEPVGVDYALAYSLVNLAWGSGQVIGGTGSSQLADAAGDRLPYLLLSGTCVATLLVLRAAAARRAASPSTSLRTG